MRTTHKLVIAATLALAPAPAAFAYPPSADHPEIGPLSADKAAQVISADAAGDAALATPLRPDATAVRLP